jgi:hypothetical protein
MDEQREALREAVSIFTSERNLLAAIGELLTSDFHRAELGVLAGENSANERLGRNYVGTSAISDAPAAR